MVLKINPLQHNVPIADERGRPTPQFLRQWQALLTALHDADRRLEALETAEEEEP